MKKITTILLTFVMLISLVACGGTDVNPTEVTPEAASEATAETRTVKGDDGVEVEIPYTVTKAAPIIGAFAQMTEMLTTGGGKIVAAATNNISDYFKEVFPDYVQSNPNEYDSTSVEDLIAAGAQVAYGPSSIFSEDQIAQLSDAGIAYVPIDNIATVEDICNAFMIIGQILGEEEYDRAKDFVDYYQGNIDLCSERIANVAAEDKVSFLNLFYSADTYTTTNGNDISNEYIEAAGGVNVAKDYSLDAGGNSITVDAEQIVAWNPQFIMASSQAGKEAIMADSSLSTVDAVVNDNVEVCPYGVYLWCVRSGEGSMLPLWIGVNLYPELFEDIYMETVVHDFFNSWYNYDISDNEVTNILAGDASTAMSR